MYVTPTDHEKREWSRLAQAAYAAGYNQVGHRYSTAASMYRGQEMRVDQFDSLQSGYRGWLISGFLVEA